MYLFFIPWKIDRSISEIGDHCYIRLSIMYFMRKSTSFSNKVTIHYNYYYCCRQQQRYYFKEYSKISSKMSSLVKEEFNNNDNNNDNGGDIIAAEDFNAVIDSDNS